MIVMIVFYRLFNMIPSRLLCLTGAVGFPLVGASKMVALCAPSLDDFDFVVAQLFFLRFGIFTT